MCPLGVVVVVVIVAVATVLLLLFLLEVDEVMVPSVSSFFWNAGDDWAGTTCTRDKPIGTIYRTITIRPQR